ncbi:MAG: hydroxyacylglutathione hydrolase [Immundisolibacteraceae bacterium]|nr:hydroxyacylglutathione hydrolase [Immundisolibacteraceae bacterium]
MATSNLQVYQFSCLDDNFGYLVHDPDTGTTATIDTPEVSAINQALSVKGWKLTHILNTHHHPDHAGGNLELKQQWDCEIIGAECDAARIPGIDRQLVDGDKFDFGGHRVQIFETPGHTVGHIVYHFINDDVAFVGDTLFSMGCGRLFEGDATQMWSSLQKILKWPESTLLYCAHEYTQGNGHFALTVEPQNADLQARVKQVDELRAAGKWTVPTTLKLEKATNPFLRPASVDLQQTIGKVGAPLAEVMGETRRLKDNA